MTQRTTSSPSAGKRLPHAKAHQLSVAPMMDWTDRHCRYFHRLLAPEAALYTEMVTADAIRHGDRDRCLTGIIWIMINHLITPLSFSLVAQTLMLWQKLLPWRNHMLMPSIILTWVAHLTVCNLAGLVRH